MSNKNPKYALLVIDMQNDFVLPGGAAYVVGAYQTIPVIRKLLKMFRDKQWPVFFVIREHRDDGSDLELYRQHQFRVRKYTVLDTPGCEIVANLRPSSHDYRIVKRRFSAFMHTELDLLLRRMEINHVVVCGTQYPTCIRSTVFDGVAYDYEVTVITDATSAQSEEVALLNIKDMKHIGVHCISLVEFEERGQP